MKDIFQNPVYLFLDMIVDLIGVNILFLLCCVPIVTIGPALTALYTITMRLVRKTCDTPVRSFWKSFWLNMKQGIALEFLAVGIGGVLLCAVLSVVQLRASQQSVLVTVLITLTTLAMFMFIAALMYLFPLQAQFANSVKGTALNALMLSIRHIAKTLCVAILPVIVGCVGFLTTETFAVVSFVMLIFGFVLIAYLQSYFLVPVFDIYIKRMSDKAVPEEVLNKKMATQEGDTQ